MARRDLYWPGHGGPVRDPQRFLRALSTTAATARRRSCPSPPGTGPFWIVAAIYQGLDPALRAPAALSVFAHLEDLVARGVATTEGAPTLDGEYRVR